MAPLTNLMRKKEPVRVKCLEECDSGLNAMLVMNHVLQSPDVSLPFVLEADASDWGVGAVSPNWTQWERSTQWPSLVGSFTPTRRGMLP